MFISPSWASYITDLLANTSLRWAVDEDRDGAFLVLPLKSDTGKVVGVVGVDTLLSPTPTQFLPHEVSFLQVIREIGWLVVSVDP